MKKQQDDTNIEAVPVMKQLARPMSQEELLSVSGAEGGCAPSSWRRNPDDFEF
jgi:hypothetical protein